MMSQQNVDPIEMQLRDLQFQNNYMLKTTVKSTSPISKQRLNSLHS